VVVVVCVGGGREGGCAFNNVGDKTRNATRHTHRMRPSTDGWSSARPPPMCSNSHQSTALGVVKLNRYSCLVRV
jgi:hypothetical protein